MGSIPPEPCRQEEFGCNAFASCRRCEQGLCVRSPAPLETLRLAMAQPRFPQEQWRLPLTSSGLTPFFTCCLTTRDRLRIATGDHAKRFDDRLRSTHVVNRGRQRIEQIVQLRDRSGHRQTGQLIHQAASSPIRSDRRRSMHDRDTGSCGQELLDRGDDRRRNRDRFTNAIDVDKHPALFEPLQQWRRLLNVQRQSFIDGFWRVVGSLDNDAAALAAHTGIGGLLAHAVGGPARLTHTTVEDPLAYNVFRDLDVDRQIERGLRPVAASAVIHPAAIRSRHPVPEADQRRCLS